MRCAASYPLHNTGMATLNFESTLANYAIAEAETLQIRTDLMLALQRAIQQRGWSPEDAAKALKQTSPRMQNLMNGEISRFSVEQLIQLLSLVGQEVHVSVAG
jgi:predicted XRE-type DNA-binding protein